MLMMRFLPALLLVVTLPVAAQNRPADLLPLPAPPPPPPGFIEAPDEPQVTIRKRGEDRVEEYRMNGRLYKIKVTPAHGTPYYLIDPRGDGGFVREEIVPGERTLSVPMWVIHSF